MLPESYHICQLWWRHETVCWWQRVRLPVLFT